MRARVGQTFGSVSGYAATTAIAKLHGGPVDPWAAVLKPVEAAVQQAADEALGFSVIARRRARADIVERFKFAVGVNKAVALPAAVEAFGFTERRFAEEEEGRNIIRQVLQGPTLDELIAQAVIGYKALLGKAFDYVYDGLTN